MREIGGLKIDSVVGSQSTIASMETNSREEEGSPEEPIQFNFFCIREYVAEVRRRDWMKCWPFKLSGNSVTDKVLASQILEDDNALVNSIPEDTEAPNLLTASQVGNAEVHEPRSEIPTDEIIGDDAADGTINGGASAEATIRANDAQFQNETNITEVAIVAENDKPQDDNAAETNNTPSNSAAIKVNDAICQNKTSFANDAITAEVDGQQDTVIGNDAVNTLGDGSSELVSNKVKNAAQSQNETIVSDEDVIIASGNDKPEDGVLNNNGADAMIDGPSEPSALEVRDARCQKEKNITEDLMDSGKGKRRRNIGNAAVNTFGEGSSKLVSNKGKNVAQSQNENSISDDDVIASGNDKQQDGVSSDDGPSELEVTDARCQNEQNIAEGSMAPRKGKRRRRNLSRRKPRKYRELADIYKQLGSSIYGSEDNVDSEFSSETSEDDDSDEVTLGTFIRGKRSVRANSKRIEALKNKRKAPEVAEPRLDRAKRSKYVRSEDNRQNDSELGSKYYMRKNRINELDLQMTNKRNEFSPDQDSLLSRGQKSNRETAQEERAREVLKPLDGNQRQEENHSRPSQGVKRAQHLVQPPVAISINDVETASGCVRKRIRETSPPTGDYENMAVLQLLRLSNAGVNIGTSSETATEDPTLSVAKPKSPSGLDASRTATEDPTLSVANPKSSSGLDASKTTTEDPTLSVAKPKSPSGLDASRIATEAPTLSVAKPKNPSGLDASKMTTKDPKLSVAKPKNPSGLDASRTATEAPTLSVAKPKNPSGLDASKPATKDPNLSVAKPKNPTWLDASKTATKDPTLSVAKPKIPTGLDASKTATKDPTLSFAKPKIPSGLDGVVPPALGSMVSKPCVEVNVIDGAGLSHAAQTKSVSYICPISRNPAEFSIPKAKKFMRRGKAVKTV